MTIDTLVVAGTDTGIGKTVLSAMLTLALDGCYWKPVQSGMAEETDSQTVQRIAGLPASRILPEAYRLTEPLSPDQSAGIDGVRIEREMLVPPRVERPLVIEGAGGLMVPLSDTLLQIDLFAGWGGPVVLAARSGLGTLNHTLLSIEALASRGADLVGVVMIGPENEGNRVSLRRWTDVPILGIVPPLDTLSPISLMDAYRTGMIPIEEWRMSA